jgi:hypothetical protein
METHSVGSFLGWFLTAAAVGMGWVLGTYLMGRLCAAIKF